ncbi:MULTISPECIES: DoxX family protein [Streptomyces]|uniref:DoxX family protein n=1 Tax=Streptomyces TaxID=1883 RepID=UPI000568888F|nr:MULTISPECIES: DoxX family membrane protein [Streptomyces]AKL64707.1 RpiR family transcriptional regulator [Streptomyces sp. Mg1]RPK41262.1 putative oxidoreductase MhqP [Streptomyces sp. ADI91-18]WBY18590.1 DoxX family membrane protein [Streptomyces goshikiensis]WSR97286.1 DoxX family membrane protein [Streptomyces goshikiensis]
MSFTQRKDLGLLALRLGAGGVLVAHGAQKLFGWFGGGGIEGTAKMMEHMGFTPPRESAIAAGLGEAGGGALLILGLATPAAGAAAAGAMAGAVSVHAPAGFFAQGGGFEYPAFLGFVAAALGVSGPGRYSLDHATGHALDRPGLVVLAFALSAAAATVVVNRRIASLAAAERPEAESADGHSNS